MFSRTTRMSAINKREKTMMSTNRLQTSPRPHRVVTQTPGVVFLTQRMLGRRCGTQTARHKRKVEENSPKQETSERRVKGSARTFKFDQGSFAEPLRSIESNTPVVLQSEPSAHIGAVDPPRPQPKHTRSLTDVTIKAPDIPSPHT